MYTHTAVSSDGTKRRDLGLERFCKSIEDGFIQARTAYLDVEKPLPTLALAQVVNYVALQQCRTPRARDGIRSQWSQVLRVMDDLDRRMKSMSEGDRRKKVVSLARGDGPSMNRQQVAQLVQEPLQKTMVSMIKAAAPLLSKLSFAVLVNREGGTFITSDEPCVWYDPEAHKRSPIFRAPALMYPSIEITLPISPRVMLLLTKKSLEGYVEVPLHIVREMNRRTRAFAEVSFVSNSPEADPFWYLRGDVPDQDESGPTPFAGS